MDMEYKQVILQKGKASDDNDYYYFEGYASTFGNVDNGGDIVVKGAFNDSLDSRMPKMVYQHNLQNPIGVWTFATEDATGLYVKGKLPKQNSTASDVGALIKCGAIDSLSIGFTVDDYSLSNGQRLLKKLSLWEVSPVTIPMNSQAKITEIKSVTPFQDLPIADRDTKWDGNAASIRVRKFTNSTDEPSSAYKKAFMWYDEDNSDNYTAYKLPYADVIGGKLVAVPQAIIAIAGVLNGARGGTSIPKADQEKIKSIVKKYYKKMKMPNPWESEKMQCNDIDYKDFDLDEEYEAKSRKRKLDDEEDDEDEKRKKKAKKLRSAEKESDEEDYMEDDEDDMEDSAKKKKKMKKDCDNDEDEDSKKKKGKSKKETEDDDDQEEDEEDSKKRKNRKSLDIWDIKSFNKMQLESVLRESGLFSKSASVYLASFFQSDRSESDRIENEQKSNSIEEELNKLKLSLKNFKG